MIFCGFYWFLVWCITDYPCFYQFKRRHLHFRNPPGQWWSICRNGQVLVFGQFHSIHSIHSIHGGLGVQYSTVQYSTVQYSTVQYSTVQYSTVQYSTVQYSTVQYSTVQYSTVQYSTVQYSTVQYSTVQYSTVQYSTVQYSTVLQTQKNHKTCTSDSHKFTKVHINSQHLHKTFT